MHVDYDEYMKAMEEMLSDIYEINNKYLKTKKDIELHSAVTWSLDVIFKIMDELDSDSSYEKLKQLYNDTNTYIETFETKHKTSSINPFTVLHDLIVSVVDYVFDERIGFDCCWGEYF